MNAENMSSMSIENHGMIGNLHTAALVSTEATLSFLCLPHFDSPSVFAHLLDDEKGGYFSIRPRDITSTKQFYLPSSNILTTRFVSEKGTIEVVDFMFIPKKGPCSDQFFPWLVRRVQGIHGKRTLDVQVFPAFDYGRCGHAIEWDECGKYGNSWIFRPNGNVEGFRLDFIVPEQITFSEISWKENTKSGYHGNGISSTFTLQESECVYFVLHQLSNDNQVIPTFTFLRSLELETLKYWRKWIGQSAYKGSWRESVQRSALTLKLLTYAPTGAIVAAPTFCLPECIGKSRNWDYRYTWIRDSAFTIYAFIRLGFTEEAANYMQWIETLTEKADYGCLQPLYSIRGESELPEIQLNHFKGHKNSKPVRIGNDAYLHTQLDIYGALLDAAYLYSKFRSTISYDFWIRLRKMVDYVCENYNQPDQSIWEVRGPKQHFLFSKIMCWVAVDRGIRLTEKHSHLPAPHRQRWLHVRDVLMDEIMTNGWNAEKCCFKMSYESNILDSSCLIMPMVFAISPTDPRMLSTIEVISQANTRGGLVFNDFVYRYDTQLALDGMHNEPEGSFVMCTLWLVEALTRAGKYNCCLLEKARLLFDQVVDFSNHLGLYSEQLSFRGEALGNFPKAFTHIAMISAAFNLDKMLQEVA